MDLQELRSDLTERFPQWAERIWMLRFQDTAKVPLADNDGSVIYYNDRVMRAQSRENRCFYMAQQLLHLQLAHYARRGERERSVWRRSCNAVVNGMLREEGFQLPQSEVLSEITEQHSAEEVYEVLYAQWDGEDTSGGDVLQVDSTQAGGETAAQDITLDEAGIAAAVAGLAELLQPSLQTDFDWFPGSTIRDGVLRYDFRAYPVAYAEILLDTSASVDAALLRRFVRGVKALLRQDAVIRVGCFDTRFYGFQDIHTDEDIDNLELHGAGGTDFTAAINAFTGDAENQIIFTDGYAEMPERSCSAVWVVYGSTPIHPKGGRVIYVKPNEEKEKHEVDFLIT